MSVSNISNRGVPSAGNARILTHNIYGRRSNWEGRRGVLIDGIRELRPDLIAFQETILADGYDQAADLLGAEFHVVHSKERETDGQGISIASRWPIGEVRELDLNVTPRTADFACTTLIAEIVAPDPVGPLLFVNHFPSWQVDYEYERELQAVIAARCIEGIVAQHSMHVVLAGDLDAEPDAASVRFLSGKQSLDGTSVCYQNAWDSVHRGQPGHTFTARNPLVTETDWDWPFQRIDHIFVRCGRHGGPTLAISACELAFGEPVDGVWASDHFGLVADLDLPEPGLKVP
jgi:endonuclease/exonuclease/phosphatase family metal-dependent hydrolase